MSTDSSSKRIDLAKLVFKPLDPAMDRAAFCCGENELDIFFHLYAAEHHERYLARVTVAFYNDELVGYYWLVAQSHASRKLSGDAIRKLERIEFAPCVYLGMIGTTERLQGQGIGKALMLHAFQKTLQVAEHVGVYALTLEAINDEKALTYKKWGFTPFVEGELLMFIPVATIRQALDAVRQD